MTPTPEPAMERAMTDAKPLTEARIIAFHKQVEEWGQKDDMPACSYGDLKSFLATITTLTQRIAELEQDKAIIDGLRKAASNVEVIASLREELYRTRAALVARGQDIRALRAELANLRTPPAESGPAGAQVRDKTDAWDFKGRGDAAPPPAEGEDRTAGHRALLGLAAHGLNFGVPNDRDKIIDAFIRAGFRPAPKVPDREGRLAEVVKLCGERFREYEALHAAKPDMAKAARNADMAALCEDALRLASPLFAAAEKPGVEG